MHPCPASKSLIDPFPQDMQIWKKHWWLEWQEYNQLSLLSEQERWRHNGINRKRSRQSYRPRLRRCSWCWFVLDQGKLTLRLSVTSTMFGADCGSCTGWLSFISTDMFQQNLSANRCNRLRRLSGAGLRGRTSVMKQQTDMPAQELRTSMARLGISTQTCPITMWLMCDLLFVAADLCNYITCVCSEEEMPCLATLVLWSGGSSYLGLSP